MAKKHPSSEIEPAEPAEPTAPAEPVVDDTFAPTVEALPDPQPFHDDAAPDPAPVPLTAEEQNRIEVMTGRRAQ